MSASAMKILLGVYGKPESNLDRHFMAKPCGIDVSDDELLHTRPKDPCGADDPLPIETEGAGC